MPKKLSKTDPALLAAVARLRRAQQLWGALLIALGTVTELAATSEHPVAGIPFILIGLLAFRWADPALLAAIAALMAFSIVPTLNPRLTILGPDPAVQMMALSTIEQVALVAGKVIVVLTAANQFFLYRFLYGTERATSDVPDQDIIPPMVPNRTDGLSRWARLIALVGIALGAAALYLAGMDPLVYLPKVLAEMGGSLAIMAIGIGLGCAFSPTDERPAALTGVAVGLGAYVLAALALFRLA
ncbi:MAG: hypothetical protein IT318_14085 [Anaerolineales bacterium]|nr:hypothetical protein [Anaerolineales bacterium]